MSSSDLLLPLWGLIVLTIAMVGGWVLQLRTRNAGTVDLLWAGGVGGLAIAYAALGSGWLPRRVLVAVLAGTWALRLCAHLARRLQRDPEDGRYANIRTRLGARFDVAMLGIFLAQGLLATLLSLAFLVPCAAPEVGFGLRDLAAVVIWAVALAGESIADRQLRLWRAAPSRSAQVCRMGLWRYSRHPNYFFEWVHWLSYPVLAIGLSFGWAVWLAPALMLFLVLKVTGIPPTEEQSLRSRGEDYRLYQRTTNAFFPGPRKSRPQSATQIT